MTGEDLTTEDLVDLKSSHVVRPRPPTLTSIPSLLSVFQNEWDALAVETYTLKQHLTQIRQELSSALYENDAAKRVIARLNIERDEARDALSKIGIDGPPAAANGGDSMQVDSVELPAALVTKVEETQEKYAPFTQTTIEKEVLTLSAGFQKRDASVLFLRIGLQRKQSKASSPVKARRPNILEALPSLLIRQAIWPSLEEQTVM